MPSPPASTLPVGLISYMPKNASLVARADLAAAAAISASAASSMAASSAESARLAGETSMRTGVTRGPDGGRLGLCAANGWPMGTPIATSGSFLAKHAVQEFQQLGLATAFA